MIYYTIYKTTNIINGKYYIGKHQTEDINDSYYGSGIALENAIKKYGKSNFVKEILFIFDNEIDMNNKEKELVNESVVNDDKSYNLCIGGEGGSLFLGKHHTEETRKKLSDIGKNRIFSEETRKKISEAAKKRFLLDESKKKLSKSLLKHYDMIGRKHTTRHIKRDIMCDINNISGKRMYIHKNDVTYRIYIEELDYYLQNGWNIGRTEEYKEYMKKKMKNFGSGENNSVYGTKWMYNDDLKETKMIKLENIDYFLSNGWKFGCKNKIYK